jgi:restriction system protein
MKPLGEVVPEPALPRAPELGDFLPRRSVFTKRLPWLYWIQCALAGGVAREKLRVARTAHKQAEATALSELKSTQKKNAQITEELRDYEIALKKWESLNDAVRGRNAATRVQWETLRYQFEAMKAADTARLGRLKQAYLDRSPDAIALHTELSQMRSPYPAVFPRNVRAAYDPESRIVVIDYQLPDIETIPILKSVLKKGCESFAPITTTERRQISDDLLFMIMLRVLREAVLADEIDAFSAVVVNGSMSFKDKATGQQRYEYLMSVHATAQQVRAIDFANVDPKICFKSLKGISAPRPTQCIPVAPILTFDKDRRVISSREVINKLDKETNLAIMPWDDFEHLIRELFEKEFSQDGVEVRVTQASRDRGVDALVFDPDPVRGGKYVIQSKRYTMTVDVSAVRDLYGTVLNEGANRGILVTTSSYGPDAYEFAKDKPLTLIDGSRLLHMLQKHGYNFRVDLKEARRLLGLRIPNTETFSKPIDGEGSSEN